MFRSLIVELSWQTGLHNCNRKLTGFFIVRLLSSWPIFVYRLSCVETGANRKLHFVPLAAYNICSPSSKCEGASVFLSDVNSWVAIGERTFKTWTDQRIRTLHISCSLKCIRVIYLLLFWILLLLIKLQIKLKKLAWSK